MAPTPQVSINIPVKIYERIALYRDTWNERFFGGKKMLGIGATIQMLSSIVQLVLEEDRPPNFQDLDEMMAALHLRGRPKQKYVKPRSRAKNEWNPFGGRAY